MAFPAAVDVFKTVTGTDPTNLSDAGHDPLSAHLNQYSASIVNTQSYILANGRGLANVGTDSGLANAYVVNLPTAPSSLLSGMELYLLPSNANTGASTLNVNSLGAIPILTPAGNPLQGGEIGRSGVLLIFDGTGFRFAGPCLLDKSISGLTANLSVECAGYTSVTVNALWSSGSALTLTLAHLSQGVPLYITLTNQTGSSSTFSIAATTPSGVSFVSINYFISGTPNGGSAFSVLAGTGSVTINNAQGMPFVGSVISTNGISFMR